MKNRFFWYFLAAVGFVTTTAFILNTYFLDKEIQVAVDQVVTGQKINPAAKLKVAIQLPELPASYTIYSNRKSQTSAQTIANELIQKYSLQPVPNLENYWGNGDQSIFFELYNQNSIKLSIQYANPTPLEKNQAAKRAQDFVAGLASFKNTVELSEPEDAFFGEQGGIELQSRPPEELGSYRIVGKNTIQGVPVFSDTETLFPLQIKLSKDGSFLEAHIAPQNLSLREEGVTPTLSREILQQKIETKQFEILDYVKYSGFSQPLDPQTITSLEIVTVSIEYRLSSQNNLLIPYLHLEGNASDETTGDSYFIKAILPVVELTPAAS